MKNKVLVELIVPSIETRYHVYLPIGRRIGNIIVLLCRAIEDMTAGEFVNTNHNVLFNADTGVQYKIEELVYHTDIRNGTKLVLL